MRTIVAAMAVSLLLIVVYLALGGASYAPARVADPCAVRSWRNPQGVQQTVEQIVLSGLDGAACKLHASREDMVLAFASRDALSRFAREHHVSTQQLDELVRAGLLRSIDDAENAGAQLDDRGPRARTRPPLSHRAARQRAAATNRVVGLGACHRVATLEPCRWQVGRPEASTSSRR
jgi:hypothetical protein